MESNQTKKEKFQKMNFFKKIWYAITKFEKYPELAALGVKSALIYFVQLILIFSILYTGVYIYDVSNNETFEGQELTLSEKIGQTLLKNNQKLENNEIIQNENIQSDEFSKMIVNIGKYNDVSITVMLVISSFISFFMMIILDIFTLSIFGMFTSLIAKIKMNYKAVFNMSIYAMTLSIILEMIYVTITVLTDFKIKYFEVMYIAVAYITLAAAIFLIKSDVIKQHLELMKIIEEGKEKIEQTITIPKKPKKDEKEEDKDEKKENKDEDEKGSEEQGSNA